jgi:hypothetical protein
VTVPQVTVPTVTVPPVTVPSVTVPVPPPAPTVTTPAVTTPTVTTPAVTTPTVTTPKVTTPTVTTPAVKTPAATVPSATVPSVSTGPSSSSGSSNATSGQGSGSSTSQNGSSSSAGASPQSPGASAGSGATAGSDPAAATATRDALARLTSGKRPRDDRALRRVVLGFQGCLSNVPKTERRVLELRAGVGISRTRTRAEVARLTGLPRKRVVRLEHRGLKRLESLAAAGSCSPAGSATPAAVPVGAGGDSVPPASAGNGATVGVLAARETPHSAASKSSDHESAIEAAINRPVIRGLGHSLDLGPLLVAFALGGLCYLVVREVRRA